MESYPNLERVVVGAGGAAQHGRRARSCAGAWRRSCPSGCPTTTSAASCAPRTGEGYSAAHKREQARIVRVALDLEDDRLEPDSSAQRPVM